MFLWLKQKYYISIIIFIVLVDQISKFLVVAKIKEPVIVIKNFLELLYLENNGIAFGLEFGGESGKIILTLLRIIILFFLCYFLKTLIKKKEKKIVIIPVSLIIAGAIGNIIDSVFYGIIFNYESLLQGRVVDMIHFTTRWPSWTPFNLSGKLIFSPVFNIADSVITIGAFMILVGRKTKK